MTPEAFNRHLGELIKFERKRRGRTQQQLAWELGISRPALANIEAGRQNMSAYRFIWLLDYFGFSSVSMHVLKPKEKDSEQKD